MRLLYQVENCDPVADGGEKMGAIRTVEQVALAIDSAQQVRKLALRMSATLRF